MATYTPEFQRILDLPKADFEAEKKAAEKSDSQKVLDRWIAERGTAQAHVVKRLLGL